MGKINLHLHSTYSDGTYTVKKIIEESIRRKFDCVSITDHNEIRGTLDSLKYQDKIQVILGMELFFLYKFKITELLVYFPDKKDIIGFYNEFIGKKLLPRVESPKSLELLVKKYHGVIVLPHPSAIKGAYKNNFKIDTVYVEGKNALSGNCDRKEGFFYFGGADLHNDLGALDCYTVYEGKNFKKDFFQGNLKVQAINNYHYKSATKAFFRFINFFLISKYLIKQFIERKLFTVIGL